MPTAEFILRDLRDTSEHNKNTLPLMIILGIIRLANPISKSYYCYCYLKRTFQSGLTIIRRETRSVLYFMTPTRDTTKTMKIRALIYERRYRLSHLPLTDDAMIMLLENIQDIWKSPKNHLKKNENLLIPSNVFCNVASKLDRT